MAMRTYSQQTTMPISESESNYNFSPFFLHRAVSRSTHSHVPASRYAKKPASTINSRIKSLFPNRTHMSAFISTILNNAESHTTKTITNHLPTFRRARFYGQKSHRPFKGMPFSTSKIILLTFSISCPFNSRNRSLSLTGILSKSSSKQPS
jgi:hypothetical protein